MDESKFTATEVISEPMEREAQIAAFRLVVTAGPDEGTAFESTSERTVVGKHESADFVLSDPTVSRFHCEFSVDDAGVQLRDLDSRNGTKIGGAHIQDARLRGTVRLTVGGTELRFEEASSSVRIPLAADEKLGRLVGGSKSMRAIFSLLSRASITNANMLIEGEPGVGKGMAAAVVHETSPRADAPLGVVSCTAPEAVVAHDLFGDDNEPGALELSSGGTVVLEDIGALSDSLQAKLQRALEERSVRRDPAGRPRTFDTRVIATSRRNLRRDVNLKRFRTPLFTQVAALRVRIPPLRARLFDVPLLVSSFLEETNALDLPAGKELLSGRAIEAMRGHTWPGNVRELRTHVERCLSLDRVLEPSDGDQDALPAIDTSIPLRQARDEWVHYFQKRYLTDALERSGGNVSAAARLVGIDRVHMHRLLKAVGLR